jgi:hypothetical protein
MPSQLKPLNLGNSMIKTALYIEEQWEDILQKKGYVVDETKEGPWQDTVYTNPNVPDISVLIHEGGGDESYFVVELNGEILARDEAPNTLWETLDKAVEIYRQSIKHPRELNKDDYKSMGIRAKKAKIKPMSKYDYEAHGNDVVLISPKHVTKILEGAAATNFWVGLDHLDNQYANSPESEYNAHLQEMIRSSMEEQPNGRVANYVIQVDAAKLKEASAPVYVSGVTYDGTRVAKFKFTKKREKAMKFSREAAVGIRTQLPEFRLTGSLKLTL